MARKNKYENCVLEIADNGIVEIVCENAEKKKDLIDLITGTQVKQGRCVLGDVDTLYQPDEYKRKVDLVDIDRVDSTLNVQNYLIFYAMVKGNYHEKTVDEIMQLFEQAGIESLLVKPINGLTKEEKIKIRCLASHMRQISCLVGKDLLEDLEWKQRDRVLSFLKDFFRENQCLCLLFEDAEVCENKVDAVWVI